MNELAELPESEVPPHVWFAVAVAAEPTTVTPDLAALVERCVRAAISADRTGALPDDVL